MKKKVNRRVTGSRYTKEGGKSVLIGIRAGEQG